MIAIRRNSENNANRDIHDRGRAERSQGSLGTDQGFSGREFAPIANGETKANEVVPKAAKAVPYMRRGNLHYIEVMY